MMPEFKTERNGYCKIEVDQYIELLRGEYANVAGYYNTLSAKMQELEYTRAELADAIVFAHQMSKKIEENAQDEAAKIIANSEKSVEEANDEAAMILEEGKMMVMSAQEEADKIKDNAVSITKNAEAEAEKIITAANNTAREAEERAARIIGEASATAHEKAKIIIDDAAAAADKFIEDARGHAAQIVHHARLQAQAMQTGSPPAAGEAGLYAGAAANPAAAGRQNEGLGFAPGAVNAARPIQPSRAPKAEITHIDDVVAQSLRRQNTVNY